MADHDTVAGLISDNGGEFDPRWPFRIAIIAREILAARARLESEDLKRRRDDLDAQRQLAEG